MLEDVAKKVLNGEIPDLEEIEKEILVRESLNNKQKDQINELDDESIGKSLEKIGVTIPSFLMPNVDMLRPALYSKKINDYLIQSVSMESSPSNMLKDLLGEMINKRTSDLKHLYSEVSESLTGIINVNIDHPIEDYFESDIAENENNLGTQETSNEARIQKEKEEALKELKKYDYLTLLTFEQFQNQQFLRSRIKEILGLNIQPVLQRLLIQKLMSHSYLEKQNYIRSKLNNEHPNGTVPLTVEETRYERSTNDNDADDSDDDMGEDEVFLDEDDKNPTYFSVEENILGCKHYQRNCKIECSDCHKWYTCRFCHDSKTTTHHLDKTKAKYILCMFCFTPQHPGQYCVECDKEFSRYYCSKCKLYDNDHMKNIYHCDKCGICRLGLGLNQDYFHCDSCNACISIELQKNHVCIENSTKSNCPICDEFMFSSNEKVVFMPCGHPIHENCYVQHTNHSYKCPTCSKTITNMELQFRMRDAEISQSKMPDELKNWEVETKCIDCGGMSRVKFHYLGHKCDHCNSYNTMQLKLIKGDTESTDVCIDNNEVDEKLYAAEQFISDSLKQNFEFDHQVEGDTLVDNDDSKPDLTESDKSITHDYVDNFIKVINNFEAYSSIGDAFKDWISGSMSDSDSENENETNNDNV